MISYEEVFENNKKWVAEHNASEADFFNKLAQGQDPEFFYIGCSDSRVSAEAMMGAKPGEVFVHRNAGNIVDDADDSTMTALEYAVDHLGVRHVVVCGHTNCGAVAAAMGNSDLGALNNWLRNVKDVYRLHREELDAIGDDTARYDRLVELNTIEQAFNVLKTPVVQNSYKQKGKPQIHAWVFDLRTGNLKDLNIDFEQKYDEFKAIYGYE